MTPSAFHSCLDTLGWPMREVARRLSCDPRLVQRWAYGDTRYKIPESVAQWLATLAMLVEQHPPPEWRTKSTPALSG